MPRTEWGWMVTQDELDSWVLDDAGDVLALNKPAHLICHPTKHGPWSSLSSAVRERFGLNPVHLISRLDRETSGVVLVGKTREAAAHLRVQGRRNAPSLETESLVRKTYEAILLGQLNEPVTVNRPLSRSTSGLFQNRQEVVQTGGQQAVTVFEPIARAAGFTHVRVWPKTGRMHQIRVHAALIDHPVAGDKLYPDEELQLEFLETGWTPSLAARLPIDRQALHASSITIFGRTWQAPLPPDLEKFLRQAGLA